MSVEQFRTQFQRIIDRRGFGKDHYIDRAEERQVIFDCVESGIPLDGAQAVLLDFCQERNYALESNIVAKINESLREALSDDGKVDQQEFDDAVAVCRVTALNLLNDSDCKKLVIEAIERGQTPIKTGFFSDWYKKTKNELGL